MQKPMYALHYDSAGKVLGANSFTHNYQMNDWFKSLDIRGGDKIEFQEIAARPEFAEVPDAPFTPAFIETPAPTPSPATVGDDQPF